MMQARKQASKAHDNSYLGQVLRGEKKMKRFVRTGGGETSVFYQVPYRYIVYF
jgi:hypothetical protein